jgi:plasmid stabilization system protein ParE
MKLQWSTPARVDLLSRARFLEERNPAAATRVIAAIVAAVRRLKVAPNIGRPGRAPETREQVVPRTP